MFSGIVVDTEGTILGLEGEVSGCGVLPDIFVALTEL